MKKRNGFTLIELLVVIVVLAAVMALTTPSIMRIMNDSKRKIFIEFIGKIEENVESNYFLDKENLPGSSVYVYKINEDLDLKNTGDFKGFVTIDATGEKDIYYITMYDKDNMILNYNLTDLGIPDKSSEYIKKYNKDDEIKTRYEACLDVWNKRNNNPRCYTMEGLLIQANN